MEFPTRGDDGLSLAELLALATPVSAAATLFRMAPEASQASRARVASGLLYATRVASWSADDGGEKAEIPSGAARGETYAVPPGEVFGNAAAIELVAVLLDRREVSLSGTAWTVPEGIVFREEMADICRGVYVALASEQSLASAYGCLANEEKSIQEARGDHAPICPKLTADRVWWLLDIETDGRAAVRAKANLFPVMLRLAEARHQVNLAAALRAEVALAAALRAEAELAELKARPWQKKTVRASTVLVRTMSEALGTKQTVGLLASIEVSAPRGATLALFGAYGPGKESLAERLEMKPRVLKTYLATMMAAFDQGNPDLSFAFNVDECAEGYWSGTAGGRLRGEIQESLDVLQGITVVAAGKWRAGAGQSQHLINCISDGKVQRFEHCFLMRAALGCYGQADALQKEKMRAMAPKTDMVQFSRAIMKLEERAFKLAVGGSLLVRDNLTQLRKTWEIVHSPEYFFAAVGRVADVKKKGVKAELKYAAKVFDEAEIGTIEVMPDGRIKTHVSPILIEAYGTTMKGSARASNAAAVALAGAGRRPKKSATKNRGRK
jgi:hypothetical protein